MSENARNFEQPIQACTSVETNEDITLIQNALNRLHEGCEKHSKELIESRNISNKLKDESKELKSGYDALSQENKLLIDAKNELLAELETAKEKLIQIDSSHLTALSGLEQALSKQEEQAQDSVNTLTEKLNELTAKQAASATQITALQATLKETEAELAEKKETQENLTQKLEEQAKELGQQAKENHDLNLLLLEKQNQFLAFENGAKKKLSELAEDSRTLKEMRKMLGAEQAVATENSDRPQQPKKPMASNDISTAKTESVSMEDSFEQWLNPPGSKDFSLIDELGT